MHELSIVESILETVRQHVPEGQSRLLRSVKVRVGGLSGVVPEALEFGFEAMVAGTEYAGARMEIERVPACCRCDSCGSTFEPAELVFLCPACGSAAARMLRGNELHLVELGMEEERAETA